LLKAHAAAPIAGAAGCDDAARLGAPAAAAIANIDALVGDLLLAPARRFFEGDLDALAQIATVAGANAERAQDVAEDAVQPAEVHEIDPGTGAAGTESRLPITVPGAALLRVAEDLVGLIQFFEARLGVRIGRVAIGMMFGGQPAECGFDVGFGGASGHTEHLVRVAHLHCIAFPRRPALRDEAFANGNRGLGAGACEVTGKKGYAMRL
jgi:hypothetical protein